MIEILDADPDDLILMFLLMTDLYLMTFDQGTPNFCAPINVYSAPLYALFFNQQIIHITYYFLRELCKG